jgi:hypothetical protein
MNEELIKKLHHELAFGFSIYASKNLDWPVLDKLPIGTSLFFQTEDPDFNASQLERAIRWRQSGDEPDKPITLVFVPVPDPPNVTDAQWAQAKVLASFVIRPAPELAKMPA